jgi:hypothetical protein
MARAAGSTGTARSSPSTMARSRHWRIKSTPRTNSLSMPREVSGQCEPRAFELGETDADKVLIPLRIGEALVQENGQTLFERRCRRHTVDHLVRQIVQIADEHRGEYLFFGFERI